MAPIDRVEALAAIEVDKKPGTVNAVEANAIGASIREHTDRVAHRERADAKPAECRSCGELGDPPYGTGAKVVRPFSRN